jgi:DNA polymerase-3 subunit gamma/tau
VVGDGVDPRQFNRQVVEYLRELLLIKVGDDSSLVRVTPGVLQQMKVQAAQLSIRELVKVVKLFNQAGLDLKSNAQSQLPLELAFVDATLGEEKEAEKAAPPMPGTVPKSSAAARVASVPRSSPASEPPKVVREKARKEEPGAAPTGLKLTLDTVNSQWGRILGAVKLRNHSVEALLKSCRPLGVEGREVVLGFYYPFHKEKIEEPKNKALVESAFSQVVEGSCNIRCVLSPKSDRQAQSVQQPVKRPQKDVVENKEEAVRDKYSSIAADPLIQEAVSKYGAQVADVQ